jgi:hypothetical protein
MIPIPITSINKVTNMSLSGVEEALGCMLGENTNNSENSSVLRVENNPSIYKN